MPVEPLRGGFGPDPRPVATGIDRVLRGLGRPPVDTGRRISEIVRLAAGADLVDHLVAVDAVEGDLVIQVDASSAASELRWRTAVIIEHLNDALGADAPATVTVRVTRRR